MDESRQNLSDAGGWEKAITAKNLALTAPSNEAPKEDAFENFAAHRGQDDREIGAKKVKWLTQFRA